MLFYLSGQRSLLGKVTSEQTRMNSERSLEDLRKNTKCISRSELEGTRKPVGKSIMGEETVVGDDTGQSKKAYYVRLGRS